MGSRRIVGYLIGLTAARFSRRRHHSNLVDVIPERAKAHVKLIADLNQVRIDRVVWCPTRRRDTHGAVVGSGTSVHGCGSCEANGGSLRPERADGVVKVIGASNEVDVWTLRIWKKVFNAMSVGGLLAWLRRGD